MSGNSDDCAQGARLEERIKNLELSVPGRLEIIEADIKSIRNSLLGRPSWFVTVIITLLSTLSVSSITFALTILKMVAIKQI